MTSSKIINNNDIIIYICRCFCIPGEFGIDRRLQVLTCRQYNVNTNIVDLFVMSHLFVMVALCQLIQCPLLVMVVLYSVETHHVMIS